MTTLQTTDMTQVVAITPAIVAPTNSTRLLLEFVRERDVQCPCCRYNLRNLTTPVCPECQHALILGVGAQHPRTGLLIATVSPGIFAGVFSIFLTLMMLFNPNAPPVVVAATGISFLSGVLSLLFIIFRRNWFTSRGLKRQVCTVVATWVIHMTCLLLFVISI